MTDYAKKKNDDLIALCKARGLPHSGKKADFVKRLEAYDVAHEGDANTAEDEIDWDETAEAANAASTEPAAEAIEAGGVGEVKNPVQVPNQIVAEDAATTNDLIVAAAGDPAPNGEAKPAQEEKKEAEDEDDKANYTQGIAERTIDEEIEKRKARAKKFGLPEDSDEIKILERAKKFGLVEGSKAMGLLNTNLSERRDRKRKSSIGDNDNTFRKKKGNRRGGGGGGSRHRSGANWMSDADRAAADRRKQRFG
ncbi:hypothetical protein K470DRAFT_219897 [Piedraia hortae CBS 480.64]|uniref:SAP domain-containing protein n=1 Tax=Piedraia hortae CBS 480.64 TaxID=1314780 RepID=A0A6A7BWC9_9PEZI|nr:hypothetical protein K470DRAFT_219897 [Piedraia hortae CBS 480.64]